MADHLPDDVLERILSLLPVSSLLRAVAVSRRWFRLIKSPSFLSLLSSNQPPVYFMFTQNRARTGLTYDPSVRKWLPGLALPGLDSSSYYISSSSGLVCALDHDSRTRLVVFNPVTRRSARLDPPPGSRTCHYSTVAVTASPSGYTVAAVLSRQAPDDIRWDVSIHVYSSVTRAWTTPARTASSRWRSGEESVICGGTLYFLTHVEGRRGLMGLRLGPKGSLTRPVIATPRPLTCGRLINMREKLVMVGGIAKWDRADVITGIGVWELEEKRMTWREVARVPHKFYQGFGELDDVFSAGGAGDVMFVQSYGSPALLMYDMRARVWKWSHKCPVIKRSSLQLFTGFCFEPRLDVSP